jgi:hypothetical protein
MAKPPFTIDELLEHTFGTNWREESKAAQLMTKYGMQNYDAFDEYEQNHIIALNRRKQELLNMKTAHTSFDQKKREELAALEWVFVVLDEIDETLDDEDNEE